MWNTEEYRRKNRLMFQGHDKLHGPSYLIDSSITASDIDPIKPDRATNEIFQINPLWRVEWKDPFQRLRLKLETIPTTSFDQFQSFELPYQQFGDDMQEIQKKDVPPKFVQIEASQPTHTRTHARARTYSNLAATWKRSASHLANIVAHILIRFLFFRFSLP